MESSPNDDMLRFRSLVESGLFGDVKKSRVRSEAPYPKPRTFDSKMMAIVEHQVLDTAVPGEASDDTGRVETPTRRHSVDSSIGRRRAPTFVRTYREVQWKRVNTAFKNSRRFSEGTCVMTDADTSAKAEDESPPDAESHEYVNGKHIIRKRVSIFISKAPAPNSGKGRRYSTGDLVPVTGSPQSGLPHGKCLIIKDLPRKSSLDSTRSELKRPDETLRQDDFESCTESSGSESIQGSENRFTEGFTFDDDDEDIEDDDEDCYEEDSEESSAENVRFQRSRPSSASSSRSPSPVVHVLSLTSPQAAPAGKSPNLRRRAMANAGNKATNGPLAETRNDGSKTLTGVDQMSTGKRVLPGAPGALSCGASFDVVPVSSTSTLSAVGFSHSTSCPSLHQNSCSVTSLSSIRRSSASCVASPRTASTSQYGNHFKRGSVRGGALPLYLQLSAPVSYETIEVPTGHDSDSLRFQKFRYQVGAESVTVFKWSSADSVQELPIRGYAVSNGVDDAKHATSRGQQLNGRTRDRDSQRSLTVSDVTVGHVTAGSPGRKGSLEVESSVENNKYSVRGQIERKGRFVVEPVDFWVHSGWARSSETALDSNLDPSTGPVVTCEESRDDRRYLGSDSWSNVLKRSLSASFRDLLELSPGSDTGGSPGDHPPTSDPLGGQADATDVTTRVETPLDPVDSDEMLENFKCLLEAFPHNDDEGGSEQLHLEITCGGSTVAIDNKIEQAMDLVKRHLMYAVREEVEILKQQIGEMMERIGQLEYENTVLRAEAKPETLNKLLLPRVTQAQPTSALPAPTSAAPAPQQGQPSTSAQALANHNTQNVTPQSQTQIHVQPPAQPVPQQQVQPTPGQQGTHAPSQAGHPPST